MDHKYTKFKRWQTFNEQWHFL